MPRVSSESGHHGARQAAPHPGHGDAAAVLLTMVWLGILAGAAELLLLGLLKATAHAVPGRELGPYLGWRSSYLWLSPHILWLGPLAAVCQLAVPGLLLATLARLKPKWVTLPGAVAVLAFVAVASILFVYQRLYDLAVLLAAAGLAAEFGRRVGANPGGFKRLVQRTSPWLGAGLVLLAVSMTLGGVIKERLRLAALADLPPDSPNVLLLILDTVRATNTSLLGYSRPTTPNLERLAQRGVSFDRAVATAPWTLPSHMSLFTGRLPHEVSASFLNPYEGEFPTLAEILEGLGYQTAGFVANVMYLGYESGLDRGFVHYEDYPLSLAELAVSTGLGRRIVHSGSLRHAINYHDILGRKSAEDVTREFLSWHNKRSSDRPFFAFLNYNDAHDPYFPPAPFDKMFGNLAAERDDGYTYQMRRSPHADRQSLSDRQVQAEVDAYDGAIAYVDQQIGVVLDELSGAGTLDNTIVLALSDHGEQFGEHGLHVHGNSVWMPTLHVPMVIAFGDKLPPGTRVEATASLRDIPRTIMSLLGQTEVGDFPGESLERLWTASPVSVDSETHRAFSELLDDKRALETTKSLVVDRYHYFIGFGSIPLKHRVTGETIWREIRYEGLYDLAADPNELDNLATDQHAGLVAELRGIATPYLRDDAGFWARLSDWAAARTSGEPDG